MNEPIYTKDTLISVTVDRGSNDGVQEDFYRVNVWQAEPRGWLFFRYKDAFPGGLGREGVNFLARSGLTSAMRMNEGKGPLGGLYIEPVTCECCGQVIP